MDNEILPKYMQLINGIQHGDVLALSRLISLVENNTEDLPRIMKEISALRGDSYCIGVTGPPGAGKSTTVGNIISLMRAKDLSVGVLCADPSSPFSGGAILGDRIRMQQHYLDNEVFIRSMSTRGSHGGLPYSTIDVIKLLKAFKKDYIIVETVGVGQTELDIMKSVDTIIVILTPESGDSIQALKAGLLEVADIFVVNKCDRPGAEDMVTQLNHMLQLKKSAHVWEAPVITTQAQENIGTETLFENIVKHRSVLEKEGLLASQRQQQLKDEFISLLEEKIRTKVKEIIDRDPRLQSYLSKVECGEEDPHSATEEILKNIFNPKN